MDPVDHDAPRQSMSGTTRSRKRTISTAARDDTGEVTARSLGSYPRKRASIACDTCRARKTRCDGAKPRCSFCEDLEIDCFYRRPAENLQFVLSVFNDSCFVRLIRNDTRETPQRPFTGADDALARVEDQLHRIEALVAHVMTPAIDVTGSRAYEILGPATPLHDHSASYQADNNNSNSNGNNNQSDTPFAAVLDPGSVGSSSRVFRTEWPDLEYFESLPPLNPIHYDDTEDYTNREIRRGESFFGFSATPADLDVSSRTINRYQQYFARNVLSWIPLFDQKFMLARIEQAAESGFDENDFSTALALLILALGAISNDDGNFHDEPSQFAGIGYFLRGFRLASHVSSYTPDIIAVQCHILSSLYFLYTTRQLQASRAITRASSDIPIIFKMRDRMMVDHVSSELAVRAFWACYIIEHELSGKISGHLSSLSDLLETMQLPSSEYEDLGSYFFSSAIALRKLIGRVMDLVPYSGAGTGTVFAPVIALELHKQLATWYQHLAPMLKFPIESSVILDPHKAFLRAQYFSILAVTKWTFVLRMLEIDQIDHNNQETLISQGRQCLESAIGYISTLEVLMFTRHLLLVVHLKGLYTITVMLLSIYRVPQLAEIMVPGIERAVERTLEMMSVWEKNPSVAVAMERLQNIMTQVGMRL